MLACTIPAFALEGESFQTADTLATLALVQGNGTNYALEDPLTRAQAAVLLVRLAGAESAAKQNTLGAGFRDIPAWASKSINYAARQGWLYGVTVTEFKPNNTVSANAWFSMLLRMLGYSDKNGDFVVEDAAAFAWRIGLSSRSYSGELSRKDVFTSMYDALSFSYKNSSDTVIQRLCAKNASIRTSANAAGLLNKRLSARQIADRHMAAMFRLDLFDNQTAIEAQSSNGNASGFFITADGLAVTNYHAIDGAIEATATLSSGECYPVEQVIYYDAKIDIAVIRVSRTTTTGTTTSAFATLDLVGTDEIRAGDVVYTMSSPLGLGMAISSGIISAPARDVEEYALPCVMNTADISQGSSGGALLNEYGQVIGVTSGAYLFGNNMYLAVPVDPIMTADLSATGMTLEEVAKLESI